MSRETRRYYYHVKETSIDFYCKKDKGPGFMVYVNPEIYLREKKKA